MGSDLTTDSQALEGEGASPPSRLADARAAAHGLLDTIGIIRAILIDDQAAPLEATVRAALAERRQVDLSGNDAPPADLSILELTDWLRERWDDLDARQRRAAYRSAIASASDEFQPTGESEDLAQLEVIAFILGDRLETVTPEEWDYQQDQLLAGVDERTLVLFDLVLAGAPEGGMTLMLDLRKKRPNVRAAVVTSAVDEEGEFATQTRLADKFDVTPDSFMLSSKAHLTPQRCTRFVDLLRVTANSSRLRALRDRVTGTAEQALKEARRRLELFDDRVLEDVIFRSSQKEGAWEIDSLLRVLGILQRDESLRAQLADPNLHDLLRWARELVELQIYEPHDASAPRAAELMSLENYDAADVINPLGLPLANGDIFKLGSRYFMLLEQPCYLQVRPKGDRGRETMHLITLPLGARIRDPTTGARSSRPGIKLPPGHGLGSEVEEVFFTPRHPLLTVVLDLCTMDADGHARYRPTGANTKLPLTGGLRALRDRRSDECRKRADKLSRALDALKPGAPNAVRQHIIDASLNAAGPLKVEWSSSEATPITYRCERVGRLSAHYADAMLSAFHAYEARAAHDHDLGSFR